MNFYPDTGGGLGLTPEQIAQVIAQALGGGSEAPAIDKSPDIIDGGDGYKYQWTPQGWMPIQSPLTGNWLTSKAGSSGGGGGYSISDIGPNSIAMRQAELAQQAQEAQNALAAQQLLTQMKIAADAQNQAGAQSFQAGQSELMRQFNAAQQVQQLNAQREQFNAQMQYNGQNSALERAAAATQFAIGHTLRQQQAAQQAQVDYFNQKRALGQDRLSAARQFADVVSLVDPAALPAFYAAGGGNVMNSLAAGANALSDNAIRPGAESLDTAKQINGQLVDLKPYPVSVQSVADIMASFGDYLKPPTFQPLSLVQGVNVPPGWTPGGYGAPSGGGGGGGTNYAAAYGAGTWNPNNANTGFVGSVDAGGNLVATPTAARGGTFTNRVITGDSPGGGRGENPELVEALGPIRVTPLDRLPDNGRALFAVLPKAAEGGLYQYNGPSPTAIDYAHGGLTPNSGSGSITTGSNGQYTDLSTEKPDLARSTQQVRDIRTGVDTSAPLGIGPYNVQFGFLPPSLVSRYFAALQSKFGVPASDVAAESRRYALQGIGLGGVMRPAFGI